MVTEILSFLHKSFFFGGAPHACYMCKTFAVTHKSSMVELNVTLLDPLYL